MQNSIILKRGKEIPILGGHPWVFSNAIEKTQIEDPNSHLILIKNYNGQNLALGLFNENNSIRVRVISKNCDEKIDEDFFVKKFKELKNAKEKLLPKDTNAYRLVHADNDYLPGLILDKYDEIFVFQIHTLGMDFFRNEIIEAIKKTFKPKAIIERSDIESRKMEGLEFLKPKIHFEAPALFSPDKGRCPEDRWVGLGGVVPFQENGIHFYADIMNGQKTGFFLDQRDARKRVMELSNGKKVLNLFSYTGAFSLYAAKGNADFISSADISENALNLAKENFKLNNLNPEDKKFEFIQTDVFKFLSSQFLALSSKNYDLIICDPPALTKSAKNIHNALKAYSDLNQKCFELLKSGGILVASSCSGRITEIDFRNALKIAASKAKKDVKILNFFTASFDHTEKISFPEGRYLKTFVLEVI